MNLLKNQILENEITEYFSFNPKFNHKKHRKKNKIKKNS